MKAATCEPALPSGPFQEGSEIYEDVGRQEVVARASVLSGSAAHRIRTEELVVRTWVDRTVRDVEHIEESGDVVAG